MTAIPFQIPSDDWEEGEEVFLTNGTHPNSSYHKELIQRHTDNSGRTVVTGYADICVHVRFAKLSWPWLARVPQIGACAIVAAGLVTECAMQGRTTGLTLKSAFLQVAGISGRKYRRALETLEEARLIRVTRSPGCKSTVEILPVAIEEDEVDQWSAAFHGKSNWAERRHADQRRR